MSSHHVTTPGKLRQFNVGQYKTLKAAAQVLGVNVTALSELLPKIPNDYTLEDFEKLDAAADILGVPIGSEVEICATSQQTLPKEPQPPTHHPLPANDFNTTLSNMASPSSPGKESGEGQALCLPDNTLAHSLDSSPTSNIALPSLLEQALLGDNLETLEFDPTNELEPDPAIVNQLHGWQTSSKSRHLEHDGQLSIGAGSSRTKAIISPNVFDMSFVADDPEYTLAQDCWSGYSAPGYANQNSADSLMSTGMGQMLHLPGDNASQVMDDFFSTCTPGIYFENNETLLPITTPWPSFLNGVSKNIIAIPEAQINPGHMSSMTDSNLTQNWDEKTFQTPSFQLAKTESAIIRPLKGSVATRTTNLTQPSFANKVKKCRGTASQQSKIAQRKTEKGPYIDDELKKQTGDTRAAHACIRCRAQKMRCPPNPSDPTGVCLRCVSEDSKTIKGPCLRLMISHCVLYRTNTTQVLLQIPPQYSNSNPKGASNFPYQQLELENLKYGQVFTFAVQQYPLLEEERSLSLLTPEGNLLTRRPYHIPNIHEFSKSYKLCIVADAAECADRLLTGSNTLTREIFAKAFQLADENYGLKSKVVRSALHFWIAARSTESGWVIRNPQSLGIPEPKNKLNEIPYVEHQLTWILMNDFLAPLCAEVLADIQKINKSGKAGDWLGQFLATFIVLHHYELLVSRQKAFTVSRKWTKLSEVSFKPLQIAANY